MNDEIKEILDYFQNKVNDTFETYTKPTKESIYLKQLLDYITNLQEQLHQASLDIQELTEKDLYCPTNCDKLTNLQQENENVQKLKERYQLEKEVYKSRIDKAIEYIVDYNLANSIILKRSYADLLNILKGDSDD